MGYLERLKYMHYAHYQSGIKLGSWYNGTPTTKDTDMHKWNASKADPQFDFAEVYFNIEKEYKVIEDWLNLINAQT